MGDGRNFISLLQLEYVAGVKAGKLSCVKMGKKTADRHWQNRSDTAH